jgi:hypothetical protein
MAELLNSASVVNTGITSIYIWPLVSTPIRHNPVMSTWRTGHSRRRAPRAGASKKTQRNHPHAVVTTAWGEGGGWGEPPCAATVPATDPYTIPLIRFPTSDPYPVSFLPHSPQAASSPYLQNNCLTSHTPTPYISVDILWITHVLGVPTMCVHGVKLPVCELDKTSF